MGGISERELAAWLVFDSLSGIGLGAQKIKAIWEHCGSLEQAWHASRSDFMEMRFLSAEVIEKLLDRRRQVSPEKLLDELHQKNVRAIALIDPEYPPYLRQIHDPPAVLYVMGSFTPDDLHKVLAVVGTRRPTAYGQKFAKELCREVALSGVTVVSGMAFGIDSFAHRAAIEGGGKTIAVLGCGPDVCYPSSNRPLYQMLAGGSHGAVISEFFPGTKPDKWRFPSRNRIISGMSHAVLVIEAGASSGALITAELAFQQSRPVLAVPGRIDSPQSAGTNALIADDKAHLVRNAAEVLFKAGWDKKTQVRPREPEVIELSGHESFVYSHLSHEPVHFDMLCRQTGLAAGELSASLTMLELAGLVEQHLGDWYSRTLTDAIVKLLEPEGSPQGSTSPP